MNENYKPYVYLLKFKPNEKFYIGVKYGKGASPDLFWVKYFTSSKIVKNLVRVYGKESFEYEILKTFDSPEKALKYEQTIIRRMNLINDNRFFNMAANNPSPAISGYIYITNGEENLMWDKDVSIPDGYRRGTKYVFSSRAIGTTWVNDGICEYMIHGEIPEGFYYGRKVSTLKDRIACYDPDNRELRYYYEGDVPHNYIRGLPTRLHKDTVWLHNKKLSTEKHLKPDSKRIEELLNDGYEYGRLETSLKQFQLAGAESKGVKGKIWVNNGVENTVVFEDKIPEGYVKGCLPNTRASNIEREEFTCPHCGFTGKGESNKHRWHFDNCKSNPDNKKERTKKIAYHDPKTLKRVYVPENETPPTGLIKGYP